MTTADLTRTAKFMRLKFDEAANDPTICKACEIIKMILIATLPILSPFMIMYLSSNPNYW